MSDLILVQIGLAYPSRLQRLPGLGCVVLVEQGVLRRRVVSAALCASGRALVVSSGASCMAFSLRPVAAGIGGQTWQCVVCKLHRHTRAARTRRREQRGNRQAVELLHNSRWIATDKSLELLVKSAFT